MKGTQISFRRWLFDDLRIAWNVIWQDALKFQITTNDDSVIWLIGKSGKFSVKSVYNALTKSSSRACHKRIWKGKIPKKSNFPLAND